MAILGLRRWLWNGRGIWLATPLSAAIVIGLRSLGLLQGIELTLYDTYVRLRPPQATDPRIAIVGIEESDVQSLGQAILPDAVYARAISKLLAMKPIAIGLDVYRDVPMEPGHQQLNQIFQRSDRIIGIQKVIGDRDIETVPAPPVLKTKGQVAANDLVTDSDNEVRRALLTLRDRKGETLYTLGTYLALLYLNQRGVHPKIVPKTNNWWQLGDSVLEPLQASQGSYVGVDAGGYQMLLNYRGSRGSFERVSLRKVLSGQLPPDWGRDRIIFIGFVGESFKDVVATPYSTSPSQLMPGVEVHANLASQLIGLALNEHPPLRTWTDFAENLWIIVWAGIGATLAWVWRRASNALPRTVVMFAMVSLLVGSTYLAFLYHWWIPVVPALMAFSLSAIAILGYLAYSAANLRKIFGRYLSNEIVDTLLENEEGLELGGENRFITLLTSDLRGFTQLTVQRSPQEILKALNFYLATMAEVIGNYQGTINEFEGDGILVFFGVPLQREDDPQRAIACGIAMQQAMIKINQQLKIWDFSPLTMGIGINTGEVVVGNIGSEKRTKYGAVGNAINLTYRIESYTIGGQILISESTRQLASQEAILGETLVVQPKGFKEPLSVHSIQGIQGKYKLQLPQSIEVWRSLAQPIPVQYSLLHDKDISQKVYRGDITQFADQKVELITQTPNLPQDVISLVNIRLNLLDTNENPYEDDIYAKILSTHDTPPRCIIYLNSIPPVLQLIFDKSL